MHLAYRQSVSLWIHFLVSNYGRANFKNDETSQWMEEGVFRAVELSHV
jgi:hypothetical protein